MTWEFRQFGVLIRRGHVAVRLRARPLTGFGAWGGPGFVYVFCDAFDRDWVYRLSRRRPFVMAMYPRAPFGRWARLKLRFAHVKVAVRHPRWYFGTRRRRVRSFKKAKR